MKGYLNFSWFLVEVEVGRNHIMSGETHVFEIEVQEVNRFFPFFFSYQKYIFLIDWR